MKINISKNELQEVLNNLDDNLVISFEKQNQEEEQGGKIFNFYKTRSIGTKKDKIFTSVYFFLMLMVILSNVFGYYMLWNFPGHISLGLLSVSIVEAIFLYAGFDTWKRGFTLKYEYLAAYFITFCAFPILIVLVANAM